MVCGGELAALLPSDNHNKKHTGGDLFLKLHRFVFNDSPVKPVLSFGSYWG